MSARGGRWRRGLIAAGVAAAALGAGAVALTRDPEPRMRARTAPIRRAQEQLDEIDSTGHRIRQVRLTNAAGLTVELTVKRPPDEGAPGSRPVVILLGGHHTGRRAVRFIPDTRGAIVAAMSYPYGGEPKPDAIEFLAAVPAIRRAFLDTPPAVSLSLDWLLTQRDADPARVEAVGVSLGGPLVSIAGALDPRIGRVWVVHGAAGAYGPLEVSLRKSVPIPGVRHLAAAVAAVIINGPQLDPARWIGRVAPRPVVFVNATDDERMPRPLVEELHAAAREPKTVVWLPGLHVRAKPEVIRPLVDTIMGMMALPERGVSGKP